MTIKAYKQTNYVITPIHNFARNAALTGLLIWGFSGSLKQAATVSAITLPLISAVGYSRSDHQCDGTKRHCVQFAINGEKSFLFPTVIGDPLTHVADVAIFFGTRYCFGVSGNLGQLAKTAATVGVTLWSSARLLSLWPDEQWNSQQHDSPLLGFRRLFRYSPDSFPWTSSPHDYSNPRLQYDTGYRGGLTVILPVVLETNDKTRGV